MYATSYWHVASSLILPGIQVPAAGLVQIFIACGYLEYKMHGGKMGADTMFDDGRVPGDFGWDPLGEWRKTS